MQYNLPNCMYVFQNCSGVIGPPFSAGTQNPAPSPPNKILAACLAYTEREVGDSYKKQILLVDFHKISILELMVVMFE